MMAAVQPNPPAQEYRAPRNVHVQGLRIPLINGIFTNVKIDCRPHDQLGITRTVPQRGVLQIDPEQVKSAQQLINAVLLKKGCYARLDRLKGIGYETMTPMLVEQSATLPIDTWVAEGHTFEYSDYHFLAHNARELHVAPAWENLRTVAQSQNHNPQAGHDHRNIYNTFQEIDGQEIIEKPIGGDISFHNHRLTEQTDLYSAYEALIHHCSEVLYIEGQNFVPRVRNPSVTIDSAVGGAEVLRQLMLLIAPEGIMELDNLAVDEMNHEHPGFPGIAGACPNCNERAGKFQICWAHVCADKSCQKRNCSLARAHQTLTDGMNYITSICEPVLMANAGFTYCSDSARLWCHKLPVFWNMILRFNTNATMVRLTASEVHALIYFRKRRFYAPQAHSFALPGGNSDFVYSDPIGEIVHGGYLTPNALNRFLKACASHDLLYDVIDMKIDAINLGKQDNSRDKDQFDTDKMARYLFGQGSTGFERCGLEPASGPNYAARKAEYDLTPPRYPRSGLEPPNAIREHRLKTRASRDFEDAAEHPDFRILTIAFNRGGVENLEFDNPNHRHTNEGIIQNERHKRARTNEEGEFGQVDFLLHLPN